MLSVNCVVLGGHVGAAPELKVSAAGKSVCTFRVATNRWDARTEQSVADWHTVIVFEKLADTCMRFLKKGSPVLVEGRVQVKQWDAEDGKRQSKHEVVAFRVNFLGSAAEQGERRSEAGGGGVEASSAEVAVPF